MSDPSLSGSNYKARLKRFRLFLNVNSKALGTAVTLDTRVMGLDTRPTSLESWHRTLEPWVTVLMQTSWVGRRTQKPRARRGWKTQATWVRRPFLAQSYWGLEMDVGRKLRIIIILAIIIHFTVQIKSIFFFPIVIILISNLIILINLIIFIILIIILNLFGPSFYSF